jgi:hypothetical protein
MPDIVLDTDALADFLRQYFGAADRGHSSFVEGAWLSKQAARIINQIVAICESSAPVSSHVIASTFAFAEIVRKWQVLLGEHVQAYQIRAFLAEPPEWFLVAAVDTTLIPFCCQVPPTVSMAEGTVKPIEWTDGIHVATVLSRNEPGQTPCYLATQDRRVSRIGLVTGRCV